MPILRLSKEFGHSLELITRLRSEIYVLNDQLIKGDPISTLIDYKKVKATFRNLRAAMDDLDRLVQQVSSEIPDLPPSSAIDPSS